MTAPVRSDGARAGEEAREEGHLAREHQALDIAVGPRVVRREDS